MPFFVVLLSFPYFFFFMSIANLSMDFFFFFPVILLYIHIDRYRYIWQVQTDSQACHLIRNYFCLIIAEMVRSSTRAF